jgi:SAM-dependent methyltransferase
MSADNIWSEFAKSYDEVIPRLHCYQRMLDKILRDSSQGIRIVDAGCGTGIVSEKLVAAGQPVYGFDNNPGMLEQAFARRESMPPGDRKNWQIEPGDVLSFPDSAPGDADTLILNNVLFYISEPHLALDESIRHLRPGAVLIATGPKHRPDPQHIFKCAFDEWRQGGQDMEQLSAAVEHFMQCTRKLTSGGDEMVTFFEPQELVALLQEAGFRDVIEASGDDYYGENFYVAMRLPE